MKNFTLFKVALCSMIIFIGCTKDDSVTKKEIKQPEEEVIDNARLTGISITTNSETNEYSYIYENDQLKQIIHLGGFNNDTSFFEYDDSTIINIAKSIDGQAIDTIYISNGKKAKINGGTSSKPETTTFLYLDGLIDEYRYVKKGSVYDTKRSYFTTILDTNTLYFTKTGSLISASSDRYYVHLDENKNIDSIMRHDIVAIIDDIREKYYYTYTNNQITVEKYTVLGEVSTLKNIDVLTLDPSIDKIIKVERFDANNVKYYEESRTYVVGNSNHELILYTHPFENPVALLRSYY